MRDRDELRLIQQKIEEAPEQHYEECLDRRTRRALARMMKSRSKQLNRKNQKNR